MQLVRCTLIGNPEQSRVQRACRSLIWAVSEQPLDDYSGDAAQSTEQRLHVQERYHNGHLFICSTLVIIGFCMISSYIHASMHDFGCLLIVAGLDGNSSRRCRTAEVFHCTRPIPATLLEFPHATQ
jgi:hypothetical protein